MKTLDGTGQAALAEAIHEADLTALAALVRSGVDVNGLGADGLTPLMIASGLGQFSIVSLLLGAGAEVLTLDPVTGSTALHKAALAGSPDVVRLLLDYGAFIDQQGPVLGHTALLDAVVYKHEEVVAVLLERGARTSIRNHWNETALDIARRDGLDRIVALIETQHDLYDAEIRGQPLVAAILAGDLHTVQQLIGAGAAINAALPMTGSPDDDYTPLALAAREGHPAIVQALMEAGAEPRRVIGLFFGTALHEACYFGHAEVVRAMTLERPAGAQAPDLAAQGAYNGFTALHDAVWHNQLDAARILVDAGHPLHLRTHAGLTARDMAVLYGYDELAGILETAERVQLPASRTQ